MITPTITLSRDYSKLNAPLLTRLLLDTDWTDILNNDIDIATDLFISAIHQTAIASIPTKRKTIYPQQKTWITSELKRNIRKRDRLVKNDYFNKMHTWFHVQLEQKSLRVPKSFDSIAYIHLRLFKVNCRLLGTRIIFSN